MLKLHLHTLGGRQFWADEMIRDGIRLQRNHWTGHYRALDARDRRLVFGGRARCLARAGRDHLADAGAEQLSGRATRSRRKTLVILLHGLYRSRHAMGRLEKALRSRGWSAVSINYPSAVGSIQGHADQVNRLLDGAEEFERVVFVTHSLGGLVARAVLATASPWRSRMKVGGLAQLGPPNQGAQLARALREVPIIRSLLSGTPRALGDPSNVPEPSLEIPILVIAGGSAGGKGFNRFLKGNNDGVVRVAETRLRRPHAFHVISAIHTLLMNHPEVVRLVAGAIDDWSAPATPETRF